MKTEDFGKVLLEAGFSDFVGVPCSYLSPLINWAINEKRFLVANNEGEAVAIASGISLASMALASALRLPLKDLANFERSQTTSLASLPKTKFPVKFAKNSQIKSANLGSLDLVSSDSNIKSCTSKNLAKNKAKFAKFGVVLMQNSGLSNALSPLTSLNHTFDIPILGFVSLRGERDSSGKNTDEPQHELLGVITDKLLETCQIDYAFLSADLEKAKSQLESAKEALQRRKCFFFIVRNGVFEKVKLERDLCDCASHADSAPKPFHSISLQNLPTRLEALQIVRDLATHCAILATTGKCGRELYELGDSPNQLYMVGSMGCVSALGLGIALKSDKKVIAIDGDSALLMRLGTLSNNAYYARGANKGNFCHILLDNHSHDSTGGQDNLSPFVDFCTIARSCGYQHVKNARNLGEFSEILSAFVSAESGGAWFIYLRIAKGSKENLGRPKITPREVAARFSTWLESK